MADENKHRTEEWRVLEDKGLLDGEELLALKILAGEACALPFVRPVGLAAGEFTVPDSFFEPLPDDLLRLFNGEGPDDCAH